jgi:CubicO group peptidase (beta-lactamase class C family)
MLAMPFLEETRIRPHSPSAVTRAATEQGSRLPVEAIWQTVVGQYETGLYPCIGLCIRERGKVVLDRTIGHVDNRPGIVPGAVATPDTPFNLFSASKMLTAVLLHALVEDGKLSLDDRVCDHVPGFERHGKSRILVRHLLTHTAGIPAMPGGLDPIELLQRQEFPTEAMLNLKPESRPGKKVAYHPVTAFLLIGKIIEDAAGMPLDDYAQQRLLGPLGFERMNYGVPQSDVGLVAKHTFTGPPVAPPMRTIFERTIGTRLETAIELSNTDEFLTGTLPMANVVANGREVTRFLELLRCGGELDGVRVLREETVAALTTEATPVAFDGTFGFPMRYSQGLMMGGNRFSLFGLGTRGAFGHLGFTTVLVYSDPAKKVSVSLLNTGKPMLAPGMLKWVWSLQRIAFGARFRR